MISDEQYLQFSPYFAQEDTEKEEDRLKFLQLLATLPQAVKELLISAETAEKVINIGATFGLDEFDTEALSLVVRKLTTGEVSLVHGTDLIIQEVGVPEEKAVGLLNAIINQVLSPVVGTPAGQAQGLRPPQKTPVVPVPGTQSRPETPQTDSQRVVDLRNRQN